MLKHTVRPLSIPSLLLGFLALGGVLRAAPAPGGPAGIGGPGTGPVAGPVEVFTQAMVVPSPFGTLLDTTTLVTNSGAEPLIVVLRGVFDWPDGSHQSLRFGTPMTIPANGAVLINALSLVPDGVGSGAGTYTATALVANVGSGGRRLFNGRLIARDQSPFVLP